MAESPRGATSVICAHLPEAARFTYRMRRSDPNEASGHGTKQLKASAIPIATNAMSNLDEVMIRLKSHSLDQLRAGRPSPPVSNRQQLWRALAHSIGRFCNIPSGGPHLNDPAGSTLDRPPDGGLNDPGELSRDVADHHETLVDYAQWPSYARR
jgi:hypothetical protein